MMSRIKSSCMICRCLWTLCKHHGVTLKGNLRQQASILGVMEVSLETMFFVLMDWRLISVGHHLYSNPDYQTAFLYYGCYISNQPLFLLPDTIIHYRSQAKNVMVDGILMASRWVVKTDWLLLKHLYAEELNIHNATSQTGRFLIYTWLFHITLPCHAL